MLDLLVMGTFFVLLVAWLARGGYPDSKPVATAWRAAADRLGAKFTPLRLFSDRAIDLDERETTVRVQSYAYSEGETRERGTRFRVSSGRLPRGLALRPLRSLRSHVLPRSVRADFAVGHPELDATVVLTGDPLYLLAVLDHGTRALLLAGFKAGRLDAVEDHGLECDLREEIEDPAKIVKRVRSMRKLAKRLVVRRSEIPSRLAANAASDPITGVRRTNLIALQRECVGTEIALAASRAALADPSPEIRLAGASMLGAEEFVTLSTLAAAKQGIGTETRLEALRHLVRRAPRETVVPVLDGLLHDAPWELRREAIAAAGALRHTGAVPLLLEQLETSDLQVTAVVARALGEIGDPRAEPALLSILRSADTEAATAAAEALARVGSVGAVQPLLDRSARVFAGTVTSASLRAAAAEAIEAIQHRLTGADNGQLALSDAEGSRGTLSIAGERNGGQVSLSEPTGSGVVGETISDVEP